MNDTAARLRLELADGIGSPGWHKALATVPRERFLGTAVYLPDMARGDLWGPVRQADMSEEEWLTLAYSNETWVTQVSEILAENATGPVTGFPGSSSTVPGLVVLMLEAARIAEGDKVLEIGTGTGYSTVLMCRRLGDDSVTSVEYDPMVAARARGAIASAGCSPTLVTGDGLYGYAENAPYDRLIATCSVRTIPHAWPAQIRAGGTITAPMCGWMGEGSFVHLTVAADGSASGRFLADDLYFMTARPHLPPPRPPLVKGLGDARDTRIDPGVLKDAMALWIAQLAVPQAQISWGEDTTFLVDASTGSRADTRPSPSGGWTVHQHGPVRLWDEIERAVERWQDSGQPHKAGFGLTVTPERQWVWLGEPDGPCWRLPA